MIQAQLLAGLIHFRAGQPAEAVRSFEVVLARHPPQENINAEALFLIGEVNLVDGDTQKAQENFGLLLRKYGKTEYAMESAHILARLGINNSDAGDSAPDRPARPPVSN